MPALLPEYRPGRRFRVLGQHGLDLQLTSAWTTSACRPMASASAPRGPVHRTHVIDHHRGAEAKCPQWPVSTARTTGHNGGLAGRIHACFPQVQSPIPLSPGAAFVSTCRSAVAQEWRACPDKGIPLTYNRRDVVSSLRHNYRLSWYLVFPEWVRVHSHCNSIVLPGQTRREYGPHAEVHT
jgi:hypothetical protein